MWVFYGLIVESFCNCYFRVGEVLNFGIQNPVSVEARSTAESQWFNKSYLFPNRKFWALRGKISFISLIIDVSSSFKFNKYLKEKNCLKYF